ncbi:protein kinase [Nocardia sp. NPDC059240]|uniref:protein kinase domain-containing protein n=1 Tax=Nocardia sp. NPDC059240 TaxID=3346786 RepID=UPI0036B9ECF1
MGIVLKPGEYFAGYQILRKLGAGGMGAVYQARDRDLPRFVALKLLTMPDGGEVDHRIRFRREADTVARLSHPNIVTVYARGEDDDRLWISMTFVDGSDVARALRDGAIHPARAVRIITETAAALDHAHETGILHRDVKPANILLTDGRRERALLTDFGIAKAIDESRELTRRGEILASFQYSAPERLTQPGDVDPRADVYSLGCTLFHMLTGEPPYPGQSVSRIIYAHAYDPVPLPSHRNPALPRGFDEVIARAMAKQPAQRYDTCAQLAWNAAQVLQQPTMPNPGPMPRTTDRMGAPGTTRTSPPRPNVQAHTTGPPFITGPPIAARPPIAAGQPIVAGRPVTSGPHATAGPVIAGSPQTAEPRGITGPPPITGPHGQRGIPPRTLVAPTGPPPTLIASPETLPETEPPDGPRDHDPSREIDSGPAGSGRRGIAVRLILGLVLGTVLALVAYLVVRLGDSHPPLSTLTTTTPVPITTTTVPVTTTEQPTPTTTTEQPPSKTTTVVVPPKTVAVPAEIGNSITYAKSELEKAGFVVQEAQREDKSTKGTVLALDPAAGTSRAVGSTVTVYVSTGTTTTTVTMPNLAGKAYADVAAILQGLGWKGTLKQTTVKVTDSTKVGKVIDQDPAAGNAIATDAPITLGVGALGPSTPAVTSPVTPTTTPAPYN